MIVSNYLIDQAVAAKIADIALESRQSFATVFFKFAMQELCLMTLANKTCVLHIFIYLITAGKLISNDWRVH